MKKRVFLAAFLCAALAGCATEYQSRNFSGGYSEQQSGPDTWFIGFSGNGYTTRETVQTFWLYRAAELTLQKGYDGFQIMSPVGLISLPEGMNAQGNAALYEISAAPGAMLQYVQFKPSIGGNIRMLMKPLRANPPRIFDARALKDELEPIVKGMLCDNGNVCPHVHGYLRAPL
ncbi:MAG TPA: hypothetical protein VEU06_07785 [Micropepsaceae bacterium]|nr:hypothetical protein [Micropepsaceae bacterium]